MFAAVVGLGAFLLFEVQLVLGKQLLPWFGGTSALWTTCLLFFQAALLAGYVWAHLLTRRLSPRRQRDAHLTLVGAALTLLAWRAATGPSPITPADAAGPSGGGAPIPSILWLLASTVGLPFVALAATSPLLQAWQARLRPGASPFWLFALSNAGSLLGLLSYPFLIEPAASLKTQGWLWSTAFVAYAAGVAWCARAAGRVPPRASRVPGPEGPGPIRAPVVLLWLALAFFPSVMLAAVTSHLTQEVAAVPLLWMLPLALYLLTFILSFTWPDAGRPAWRLALAVAAALALAGLYGGLRLHVAPRLALWCAVLFGYGMAGHGELAQRRPEPGRLTSYYLAIAAGGALGGLLAAVAAPLLFDGYWELHLGLLAGPLVVLAAASAGSPGSPSEDSPGSASLDSAGSATARQARVAAAMATLVLAVALATDIVGQGRDVVRASRSFYGVLRVVREDAGNPNECLKLLHGRISHGIQIADPARRGELTSYVGPSSGAGLAIRRHPRRLAGRPVRIGVIGLGVGTLAAWSLPGDVMRFYELDPAVARLSQGEAPAFTYLRDARGTVSVALGDGRRALEGEPPQGYDVLVVDAFSSDAVPTHLLTHEAFAVYLRHLADGGVLAVQITNRYVDLEPVVRGAAAALSLDAEHVPSFEKGFLWSSDWMLVARDRAFLDDEVVSAATLSRLPRSGEVLWTDDWSDLFRVIKR